MAEAGAGALGHPLAALSTLALAAPGLALVPLLPRRVRESWPAALAAAPALGYAASSVALISAASAGARLDGTTVRLVLAAAVLAGLLAFRDGEPRGRASRGEGLAGVGLVAAVAAGVVLEARVIGGSPVPGNDWAKYVLYADEIARQGSLLIDNPFWMLGVPFREDPGAPAVYGAYLGLTGEPADAVMHGIWAFAVMGVLSTFALVRAFWGELAAVLAAAFWAVVPISQDILGWHGLANTAALALLPLVLLHLGVLLTTGLERGEAAGFGLLLVALAASHRLSFLVGAGAVGAAVAIALAMGPRRGAVVRGAGLTLLAALALSPGVAYDLVSRSRTFGGTQDYTAYLSTKVDLSLVGYDLTLAFSLLAVVATADALRRSGRERALLPVLCLLAVVVALAYAWIVHLPLVYFRMAYFLPVALAPLVAVALTRLLRPRAAAAVGAALVLVVAATAWGQAENVRRFYAFANDTSLRGLDAVASRLRPGEVIVTDRCWSFLGTWLLHTRSLPALEPEDIQPRAERARAEQARSVLAGTPAGRSLAQRLGARFVLVDPTCTDAQGRPATPPVVGVPLFVSERLVVLRLPAG